MEIKIDNTLTQKKDPLPDSKTLKMFVCGPTVYGYIHIGNARTYVVFDMFARYLRSRGLKVSYLQNITDIDDKIINKAKEEGVPAKDISERYTKAFKKNVKELGIDSVDTYAPATKFIKEIVSQVETLIKKGSAYKIEGDGYYFDLSTFPDYGKLAKRTIEQAEDGVSRIDENPNKRNKGDFCLWKFSKEGEPSWKTKLGEGRPGWHIEDTAITEHFFGPQYDIHGGGSDLIFPHHEAEVAQQESASGKKPFVKLWMHVGMLTVNGRKMSKSLGNIVSINSFLKDNHPDLFRFIVLAHHYRSHFDYNPIALEESRKMLTGILTFMKKLEFAETKTKSQERFFPQRLIEEFDAALADDFNTPKALGVLFEIINEVSPLLWIVDKKDLKAIRKFFDKTLKTFGIHSRMGNIPLKIRSLAKAREKFRSSRQFMQADDLRKKVDALGYIIEDTPGGPFLCQKLLK